MENASKSELGIIEFIDEASLLLSKHKTLKKIIIKGETTSIVIEKPEENNDKIDKKL